MSKVIYCGIVCRVKKTKTESPCMPVSKGIGQVMGTTSPVEQCEALGKNDWPKVCWPGTCPDGLHEQCKIEYCVQDTYAF